MPKNPFWLFTFFAPHLLCCVIPLTLGVASATSSLSISHTLLENELFHQLHSLHPYLLALAAGGAIWAGLHWWHHRCKKSLIFFSVALGLLMLDVAGVFYEQHLGLSH